MKKVLIVGGFFDSVKRDLEKHFEVVTVEDTAKAQMMGDEALSRFEGLASFGWGPATFLDRMDSLEILSSFGVGYDGIDARHAASKGITVTHTPDVLNDDVANLAIALTLMTQRRLAQQDAYVRAGRWAREGHFPLQRSIRGKTVGIVGLGRIGKAIADKLSVFGCRVAYHGRRKQDDVALDYHGDLIEMATASDVLIVITPGGPATHHLIDGAVMDALGPEGCLVNVARGSVVDENALVERLADGRLGSAGLDVFDDEPNVPEALYALDNVTLTPHTASATWETRQAMADLVVENLILALTEGRVKTPVPECADTPLAKA